MKKIIFFLIFIMFINNVNALTENITNDTYVDEQNPTSNFATDTRLYTTSYVGYYEYTYLELPTVDDNNTLHIFCINLFDGCANVPISIYNVSSFNYSTIIYNTQPSELSLVINHTFTSSDTSVFIGNTSKYLKLKINAVDRQNAFVSSQGASIPNRPYITNNITSPPPPPPPLGNPSIISYSNNYTNDNSLTIYVNQTVVNQTISIKFNISVNQSTNFYNWSLDNINISNNFNNITFNFNDSYNHTVSVYAINENGSTNIITWNIYTVHQIYFGINNYIYISGYEYNEPKPYFTYNTSSDSINITKWITGEAGASVNYPYSASLSVNFTTNSNNSSLFFIHGASAIAGESHTQTDFYIDSNLIESNINGNIIVEMSLNNSIHNLYLLISQTSNGGGYFLTGYENAVYLHNVSNVMVYLTPIPTPIPPQISLFNGNSLIIMFLFFFVIFYLISFRDRS